jgi:ABC-type bacteriocin/lantibiotic exporter with double-glycine peptidase domain
VHHPEDERVATLELPGYRQARNYACGFASALMVMRHFDIDLPGRELFSALGTARDGTGQSAIVRVLRENGLRANLRYDLDFERLRRCIDAGKPLIGYLDDEEHWLVIYGYGREPRRVFVADPEPGKSCEHPWESYGPRLGCFGIVCSPRPRAVPADAPTRGGELAAEAVEHTSMAVQLSFDFGGGG